jgi:hypothetical protein
MRELSDTVLTFTFVRSTQGWFKNSTCLKNFSTHLINLYLKIYPTLAKPPVYRDFST